MFLLLACSPWSGVAEREAVWYDADRVEGELLVDLVELQGGAPIGYWPRVVVREDGIDFDNRAWFLTQPAEVFAQARDDSSRGQLEATLIEATQVADVIDGAVPDDQTKGQLITALYELMRDAADAAKETGDRYPDAPFEGRVSVVVEPGVPYTVSRTVLYTAGQAQYGQIAMVGRSGTTLRGAHASGRPGVGFACALDATMILDDDLQWVQIGEVPLVGPQGCETESASALMDSIAELPRLCRSRWDAGAAEVFDDGTAPSADWECVHVALLPHGAASSARVLGAANATYAHHPTLVPTYYLGGVDDPDWASSCPLAVGVEDLSDAQLDVVCDSSGLQADLDFARDRGDGLIGLGLARGPKMSRALGEYQPDAFDAAFPELGHARRLRHEAWVAEQAERPGSLFRLLGTTNEDTP